MHIAFPSKPGAAGGLAVGIGNDMLAAPDFCTASSWFLVGNCLDDTGDVVILELVWGFLALGAIRGPHTVKSPEGIARNTLCH